VSGKISDITSNPPAASPSGASPRAPVSATPASQGTGATDNVQITDTASHLATAEQALIDIPVISQGRVAGVRDSLAAGTYKISPERIANKLLQFERLLPDDAAEAADPADSTDSAE
jgi:negative regulator of flagellin synthesis FlgM